MKKLTDEAYWKQQHLDDVGGAVTAGPPRQGLRGFIDRSRTSLGAEASALYPDFLFELHVRRHLPRNRDWLMMELGCAPCNRLMRIHDILDYQPWGVEYSELGVENSRAVLAAHGFPPDRVILSDMFAPEFQEKHKGRYDVVYSRGLIEHFDDPSPAIAVHRLLLKHGGYLVLSIPNLRGWAYPVLKVFNTHSLDTHNLQIMRLKAFRNLFAPHDLDEVFCGYFGQFSLFGLPRHEDRPILGAFSRSLNRAASIADHLMFMLLRGKAIETRFSPHLLYIGRAKS